MGVSVLSDSTSGANADSGFRASLSMAFKKDLMQVLSAGFDCTSVNLANGWAPKDHFEDPTRS